jgi:hypothetical protein
MFSVLCDLIILVAAVLVAIANIYKFFNNSGKGVRKKLDEVKAQQKQDEEQHIRDVIAQVQEEQSDAVRQIILDVVEDALPNLLIEHDLELREKYKSDRLKYLKEIKTQVEQDISA